MTLLDQPTIETTPRPAVTAGGIALGMCALVVIAGTIMGASIRDHHAITRWWPLVVLGISLTLVITLITVVRLHALLSLILAALATGLMARVGTLPNEATVGHWLRAVELTTAGFGETAGKIAIVIILAAIIGVCMLESGAADRIVGAFLDLFGVKRAGLALLVATYIVSIPIFFDTIFMLLLPLAHALYRRTGRDFTLYAMAICCAAGITHSMIIPHPGPAAMAGSLKIDAGLTIWVGLLTGLVPMACGWLYCLLINRWMPIQPAILAEDLPERTQIVPPPLWLSLLPVILPVLLIGFASSLVAFKITAWPMLSAGARFIGDRNIALVIGTVIAIGLFIRQRGLTLQQIGDRLAMPLETAGMIILITSAGGAFGLMLHQAGVGNAIQAAADGRNINLIVLAWLIALVIRIAQGSATVAMLTTAAMVQPMMAAGGVPPICIFLAIGYGALGVSWMNDSGFWLVSRLGGFTEAQTLKSWTVLVSIISLSGLGTALALSWFLQLFAGK